MVVLLKAGKQPRCGFSEKDLKQFKVLRRFQAVLGQILEHKELSETWKHPARKLAVADYLSLYLFSLLNPVIESMRGACAASHLERVSAQVCSRPVSLGSFSEAQHLVDEDLLQKVFERLKAQLPEQGLSDPCARLKQMQIRVIDSSVWPVCKRLDWALWRPVVGGHNRNADAAVRMHTVFDLHKGIPEEAELTKAKLCERKIWKQLAKPGHLYIADRYYSYDYALLGQMQQKQVHFLVRCRIDAQWVVEQELPLSEADRRAHVTYSAWVRLGKQGKGPKVRVVQVLGEEESILLLTSLPPETLSAEQVAILYRERWQIECFFHWFKCILRNRHWFCESEKGLQTQVYLALIAAVLLMLFTAKRPNKRCMELIQMFLDGWCSEEELPRLLKKYL